MDRVQEVGRHVALGSVGVFLLLLATSASRIFHGHVVLHFFLVAKLVLFGFLVPHGAFIFAKSLELGGQETSLKSEVKKSW